MRGQRPPAGREAPVADEVEHQVVPRAVAGEVGALVVDRRGRLRAPRTSSTLRPLHTPVTSAPSALATCTANVPTPPDAPLTSTFCPGWTPAMQSSAVPPASGSGGRLLEGQVRRLAARRASPGRTRTAPRRPPRPRRRPRRRPAGRSRPRRPPRRRRRRPCRAPGAWASRSPETVRISDGRPVTMATSAKLSDDARTRDQHLVGLRHRSAARSASVSTSGEPVGALDDRLHGASLGLDVHRSLLCKELLTRRTYGEPDIVSRVLYMAGWSPCRSSRSREPSVRARSTVAVALRDACSSAGSPPVELDVDAHRQRDARRRPTTRSTSASSSPTCGRCASTGATPGSRC